MHGGARLGGEAVVEVGCVALQICGDLVGKLSNGLACGLFELSTRVPGMALVIGGL